MDAFLNDMDVCCSLTDQTYPDIIDSLRFYNITTTTTSTTKGFCFDIILPTNHIVKAIQISICPFLNKDIALTQDIYRRPIFETALIGFNDSFIYNKGLLYDDEGDHFRQFLSIQDVTDEVKRIIRTVI